MSYIASIRASTGVKQVWSGHVVNFYQSLVQPAWQGVPASFWAPGAVKGVYQISSSLALSSSNLPTPSSRPLPLLLQYRLRPGPGAVGEEE